MRCIRRGIASSMICVKTLILISVLFVLYAEFIVYYVQSYKWKTIPITNKNKSIRLLFISDPQIQGYENEPGFPFGLVTRWDSDRYLSKTFSLAVKHTQPDMIIFLGDLMDEGSIATDDVYASYTKRFMNVFATEDIEKLYIPGDNDIGGEGDKVTEQKVNRFSESFHDDEHVIYKFVEFARVNYFTRQAEKTNLNSTRKKIIVTHFPLLPVSKIFGKEIISKTGADLIFSAHDHSSIHFLGEKNGTFLGQEGFEIINTIWIMNLNDTLHEILVPTCSYRMGRPNMGYGFAVVDECGTLQYTILWLPDRYMYLFLYVKIGFILGFCIVVKFVKSRLYG